MRYGAVFPTNEIGNDPAQIRAWAQATEEMGFHHAIAFDHVLGADPDRPGGWQGPYTIDHPFHEPLVLFAYLSAVTTRLEFMSGVIILPQRQAVLVAKQAAQVDVLSGGRLRLGVGLGWNAVEYDALGESFRNRGSRIEEQIDVMRALWTRKRVDFSGRWHRVDAAGINPMPLQQPIPVWFGAVADAALDRIGRIGDGWYALAPPDRVAAGIERVRASAEAAGRDPSTLGLEGMIFAAQGNADAWPGIAEDWRALGATHLSCHTMNAGYTTLEQHLEALRRFKDAVIPSTAA